MIKKQSLPRYRHEKTIQLIGSPAERLSLLRTEAEMIIDDAIIYRDTIAIRSAMMMANLINSKADDAITNLLKIGDI